MDTEPRTTVTTIPEKPRSINADYSHWAAGAYFSVSQLQLMLDHANEIGAAYINFNQMDRDGDAIEEFDISFHNIRTETEEELNERLKKEEEALVIKKSIDAQKKRNSDYQAYLRLKSEFEPDQK